MANASKNKKKRSKKWTYRQKRAVAPTKNGSKNCGHLSPISSVEKSSHNVHAVDKEGDLEYKEMSHGIAMRDVSEEDLSQVLHDIEKSDSETSSVADHSNWNEIEVTLDGVHYPDSLISVEENGGIKRVSSSDAIFDTREKCGAEKLLDKFVITDRSEKPSSLKLNDFEKDVSVNSAFLKGCDSLTQAGLRTDAFSSFAHTEKDYYDGSNIFPEFHDLEITGNMGSSCALQVYGGYEMDETSELILDTRNACETDHTRFYERACPSFDHSLNQLANVKYNDPVIPTTAQYYDVEGRKDSSIVSNNSYTFNVNDMESSTQKSSVRQCSLDVLVDDATKDGISSSQSSIEPVTIEGRRIVDLNFFFSQLHKKLDGHKCPFGNVFMSKYTNLGLRTKMYFGCSSCDYAFSISTDSKDGPLMEINKSAVCGTITSGVGCSNLQELLSSMAIPSMSHVTYIKNRDHLYDLVTQVSEKEMIRASSIESELAIKEGNVVNGIPCITVVSDGAWAKRSFASGKHDSLSGVGIIAGHRTGLILFVSVRNKYCAFEAKAEQMKRDVTPHRCHMNFGRDQSSSSMEKDIILEGFQSSVQNRGLIYKTLISDGDSSVYNALLAADPYGKYGVVVRKVECNNHLFRNLCKKLRTASGKAIPRTVAATLSISVTAFRSKIDKSGLRIRQTVESARDFRNTEEGSEREKSCKLQNDILQILQHVFGDHSKCENLPFLNCEREVDKNLMQDLQTSGIYPDVLKAVQDLSCHAISLLQNVTNNVVEACNSLVNKCNIGKRTNQCARNSYEIRCHAATIQHNTQNVLSKIHDGSGKAIPHAVSNLEKSRQNQVTRNAILRQDKVRPEHRKSCGTDKDYGPSAQKPDREGDVYDILVRSHLEKLKVNQAKRDQIERKTVLQSDCDQWQILRTDMITASKFGQICRMLDTTSCSRMVLSIIQPKVIDTEAVRYGITNENTARITLEVKIGKKIIPCGLFIDKEIPYLGASPDGLIDEDGIIEIKCPFSAKDTLLDDALKVRAPLRAIFDKKNLEMMNKNHQYYYQVQGQLHIANRQYCIFALWTSVDLKYITVQRDDEFWRTKMEPFLSRFYMQCLLPEIVDSRRARCMPLREPDYILRARDAAKHRKEKIETNVLDSNKRQKRLRVRSPNTRGTCDRIKEQKNPSQTWVTIDDGDANVIEEAAEIIEILRKDISVHEVIADIEVETSLLNDSSIDMFLQIVKENSEFNNIYPASYTGYCSLVKPSNKLERDMQIIGGNKSRHWCCVLYAETTVMIYDSLCRCEYEFLHEEEKSYIRRRYGHVNVSNIMFMPVTRQPDGFSCGVYAAAFATTIALGSDPAGIPYSRDAVAMRKHLITIIQHRRLLPFPTV